LIGVFFVFVTLIPEEAALGQSAAGVFAAWEQFAGLPCADFLAGVCVAAGAGKKRAIMERHPCVELPCSNK